MRSIAFFDTKPYDREWFEALSGRFGFEIKYFENRLTRDTAVLARGMDGICAFVNDELDGPVIETLYGEGIRIVALRSAGYNNVDFKAAFGKVHVVRVPAYSPNAVAEYAAALLLTLVRKTHRAYTRTRDHNFSINGLTGFNLAGKTAGIVGTGQIGRIFGGILKGFGMRVIAYDPHPARDIGIEYVSFDQLCAQSDVISLHCPLTKETRHLIDAESLAKMKPAAVLVNTSRGAIIDSRALLEALRDRRIGGAALDVYEEETEVFFEDISNEIMGDEVLTMLLALPNVLVSSHQAFLTDEALRNIAQTTLENLEEYFGGGPLKNEICYKCVKEGACGKTHEQRCF